MIDTVAAGSWVEIHAILLAAGKRAPQVPDDTKQVPLEMKVRGFLLKDARLGDEADIRTASGRCLSGTLSVINPGYEHGFGLPLPALSSIAEELRTLLSPAGEKL